MKTGKKQVDAKSSSGLKHSETHFNKIKKVKKVRN